MKGYATVLMIFLAIFQVLILSNYQVAGKDIIDPMTDRAITYSSIQTLNIDGDLSLGEAQNRIYWNPHSTGFTPATVWKTTFADEVELSLRTAPNEAGHVATGAWWTTSFKSKAKIPLYTSNPIQLIVSFRANVVQANSQPRDEWLRIALAAAVQRNDGSVVYTEMDFWDSPNTLKHPTGNTKTGGNIIYKGGDVVEYKIDQATLDTWTNYSVELTRQINSAWSLRPGDLLESVYIVVETIGSVDVTLKVDGLLLIQVS